MAKPHDFSWSKGGEPHALRRKEMLAKYGEQIKKLYGPDNGTAFWSLAVACAHVGIAVIVRNWPWWRAMLLGWSLGGFFANNITAALHECCHYLVFRTPAYNRWLSYVVNCPIVFPAATGFRKYHLEHHSHLGVTDMDVDLPTWVEANYVTNVLAKLVYSIVYMGCYSIRPLIIKPKPAGKDDAINAAVVFAFDAAVIYFLGWSSMLYLFAGIGLGGGLHPMAGHLIAEHYLLEPGAEGQETYSYYGPANTLVFNVGYHNEHHDFPQIPGSRLPKLREIAPEYYDCLHHHTSYCWVLWKFITDPAVGPWSRLRRVSKDGPLDAAMGPHKGSAVGAAADVAVLGTPERKAKAAKGAGKAGLEEQAVNGSATPDGTPNGTPSKYGLRPRRAAQISAVASK